MPMNDRSHSPVVDLSLTIPLLLGSGVVHAEVKLAALFAADSAPRERNHELNRCAVGTRVAAGLLGQSA
jgi:hypothetical protein